MNQPEDISMNPEFCSLCGITQEELEKNFDVEIDFFAKKYGNKASYLARLKSYYNGYLFAKEGNSVYNPTSIIKHFLNQGDFNPFWIDTGTPSFLVNYIKEQPEKILDIDSVEVFPEAFAKYNKEKWTIIPLLYQSGYLTIASYNQSTNSYKLKYPNGEVKTSFAEFLSSYFGNKDTIENGSAKLNLTAALKNGNVKSFMKILESYLQGVDYSLIAKIKEHYFSFAVSNVLRMLGYNCNTEVRTATGSVDCVIEIDKYIYVMEFKLDKSVASALKQIESKGYAIPYKHLCNGNRKKIIKLGVKFSSEKRNIVDWGLC